MLENTQEKADQKTLNTIEQKETLSFSSVSFFPYDRSIVWYAVYLLFLSLTVYFSLKYSAPLFSAILVFVSGFYLASTLSTPVQNKVSINAEHLMIDSQVFPISDFASHWIEPHGPNYGFLHIYKARQVLANKEIPYLNTETDALSNLMQTILPENTSQVSHNLAKISHILKI